MNRRRAARHQMTRIYLGPNAVADPIIATFTPPKPDEPLPLGVTQEMRDGVVRLMQEKFEQFKARKNDPYAYIPNTPRERPKAVADQLDRQASELEAVRDEASRRILRLLTRRQRDLVKKMQGEPFPGLDAMKVQGPRPKPKDEEKAKAKVEG